MAEVMSEWTQLEPKGWSKYGHSKEPNCKRTNILCQIVPGGILLLIGTNSKPVTKTSYGTPVIASTGGGKVQIGKYTLSLDLYEPKLKAETKGMDLRSLSPEQLRVMADYLEAQKNGGVEEE